MFNVRIDQKKLLSTGTWKVDMKQQQLPSGVYSQTWETISGAWWPQLINILSHYASSYSSQPSDVQITGKPSEAVEQPHRGISGPKTFQRSLHCRFWAAHNIKGFSAATTGLPIPDLTQTGWTVCLFWIFMADLDFSGSSYICTMSLVSHFPNTSQDSASLIDPTVGIGCEV